MEQRKKKRGDRFDGYWLRDEVPALNQIMTYLESKIEPQIRLLAEGHENLMRTLSPKERVDRLEGDVVILKQAVHTLREDVDQLKQAE